MTVDEVAAQVVDAAVAIHKKFGPGLLEHVYRSLLRTNSVDVD